MRAWRVHELGEPDAVLRLDDVDDPVAGPGEVLVDVAAASLNFPDVLMCRGEYQVQPPPPFTPGSEATRRFRRAAPGASAFARRCRPDDAPQSASGWTRLLSGRPRPPL